MSVSPIGNLLNGAVKRAGIGRQITAAFIIDRANVVLAEVLPTTQVQHLFARTFANGVLTIAAKNGSAKVALMDQTEEIKEAINKKLGGDYIQTLIIRIKRTRL